jgi:ADP-ribose pyrophosphatase
MSRKLFVPLSLGFLLSFIILSIYYDYDVLYSYTESNFGDADPGDPFPEAPWVTARTLGRQTVVSSSFARFEVHHVRRDDGTVAKDWLWTDERSHVNVLVHLKEENKYLLFKQTKYGLLSPKYATVGGLFNAGESPEACARRELLEETGLLSEALVSLGAYRVQADRGGGMLHVFLARECYLAPEKDRLKSDDFEKQAVHKLTMDELLAVVRAGGVGEAQWLAAVTLGALHDMYKHPEHGSIN